jgi:hypothetical protein
MVGAPGRVSARIGVRVGAALAAAFVVAVALVATGVALVFLVSGSLRDTLDAADLRAVIDSLLFYVLVAVPVLIIVVGLTTFLFVGRALRPVEALRKEVVAATQGSGRPLPEATAEDEVARLAETMNALLDRLGEANAAQQRLGEANAVQHRLAAVGHELRGPLAALAGELGQIQRGSSVDRASIGALRGEVERLGRVVEAVLTGAALPAGPGLPPRREDHDPRAGDDQLTGPVSAASPPGGMPTVRQSAVQDPGERTTVITPLTRGPQDDRPVRDEEAKEDPITAPRGVPVVRPGEGSGPVRRYPPAPPPPPANQPPPNQPPPPGQGGPPQTNPRGMAVADPRGMPPDPRGSSARGRIR